MRICLLDGIEGLSPRHRCRNPEGIWPSRARHVPSVVGPSLPPGAPAARNARSGPSRKNSFATAQRYCGTVAEARAGTSD